MEDTGYITRPLMIPKLISSDLECIHPRFLEIVKPPILIIVTNKRENNVSNERFWLEQRKEASRPSLFYL